MSGKVRAHLLGMLEREIVARDVAVWTADRLYKDMNEQSEEGYNRIAKQTKAKFERQNDRLRLAVGNINALEKAIELLDAENTEGDKA